MAKNDPVGRRMLMGHAVKTGEPYTLAFDAFRRGMTVRGPIGSGKTTLLLRMLMTFGLMHNVVHLDFSGTGAFLFQTFLANLTAVLAVAGEHAPMVRQLARSLMARHAFGVLHDGAGPMPIRIDLLRRRRLANGELETISQVVDRVMLVLDVKLNTAEPQIRVLYRRICRALVTALVAAEQPISKAIELLDNRVFAAFVFRQIETAHFGDHDRLYLVPQLQELRRTLALYDPEKPSTRRQFDEQTGSTRNALMDFVPGTVLGRFLGSDETFNPEGVAFGRQSLSLSTTITDPVLKAQGFQAVHGILHALFVSRGRAARLFAPVSVVTDEIKWLPHHIADVLAMTRNYNVSYVLCFQDLAQWKDLGLETMPDQLRSLTELAVTMRPSTRAEAEDEALRTHWIRPGETVQHFVTQSSSRGQGATYTLTKSLAETLGKSRHGSYGTARSRGESEGQSDNESSSISFNDSSGTSTTRGCGSQRSVSRASSEVPPRVSPRPNHRGHLRATGGAPTTRVAQVSHTIPMESLASRSVMGWVPATIPPSVPLAPPRRARPMEQDLAGPRASRGGSPRLNRRERAGISPGGRTKAPDMRAADRRVRAPPIRAVPRSGHRRAAQRVRRRQRVTVSSPRNR